MKYETIEIANAVTYFNSKNPSDIKIVIKGDGDEQFSELYSSEIASILSKTVNEYESDKSKTSKIHKDVLETIASIEVYALLKNLPACVLTDNDFWRYLSIVVFREFVFWRNGKDTKAECLGAETESVTPDCIAFRMFNKGLLLEIIYDAPTLQSEIFTKDGSTDIWVSHILRVKTGYSPFMVKAFLESKKYNINTDKVRYAAKKIKLHRTNVLIEFLNEDESAKLFQDEVGKYE